METKNLEVNLSSEVIEEAQKSGKPVVLELHHTEHTAPTLNEKVQFEKHVTIKSIREFLDKKTITTPIEENKGVIIYCLDANNAKLSYYEDPNDELATVLTSKLRQNPDFLAFKINTQEHFTQKQLEKLILRSAHCFQNIQDAKDLIQNLRNFEVKYEQVVKRTDNRQGDTLDLVTTAIKSASGEITGELKLTCPLFIGTPKYPFSVVIEIEKGPQNLPNFGFYSLDLQVLMIEQTEKIVMQEVEYFSDKFVCLEVES